MSSLLRPGRITAAMTVAGLAAGCATSAASTPPISASAGPSTVSAHPVASTAAPAAAVSPIDRLTNVARRRYRVEAQGSVANATARRVARDPALLRTLQSGNVAATQAYVKRQFAGVWYHWHVSRMRIARGSTVVVETGVPFVVSGPQVTLRGSGGRSLGTLEVSIQDEVGFVRYMHRNYPVDVVVRGQGAGHMRTSLPAAANVKLPSQGPVTIAGRRYLVRSFQEKAWSNEPVTAWILAKA
jgi:hypothetical protein